MSQKSLQNISRACMLAILVLVVLAYRANFRLSMPPLLAGGIFFVLAAIMNVTNIMAQDEESGVRWKSWKWYMWLPSLILPAAVGTAVYFFVK